VKRTQFAQARPDCIFREFYSEVVVYDPERHVAHCLNSTATAVWRLCDGNSSPRQIATELSRQVSAPVEEAVVLLALRQLADAHLLAKPEEPVESPARRAAIGRIGRVAAIVLPLVTSLGAPTPAQALSCLHNGQPCTRNSQCCSGDCGATSHRCNGG
jgi:Coenzyme PQQ synthesis protein D (PqqD)